ncbi:hypothetical protein ACHAWO_010211 [Cyclotella atomus]|uniref:Uncharacterized protein n=1 Tax=Cyclotella atomus TaxID=382360 RepID=A0ABD3Q733_9STRA
MSQSSSSSSSSRGSSSSSNSNTITTTTVTTTTKKRGFRLPNFALLPLPKTKKNKKQGSDSVPIETVRKLLMGTIDPVDLARQILPPKDLAAVVRYSSAPYRPKLDLRSHNIITAEDVLFVGLTYVGFDGSRQDIRDEMNRERFCSFFKLCPEGILDAYRYFSEHSEEEGDIMEFRFFLIALNFLKLYDTEHVLSGRWRLDEETLRKQIWKTLWQIQRHFPTLIYFDPSEWDAAQVHLITVDTVNYNVNEQRSDPVGKFERWYNHKSNSAGVKYEMALPLCLERQTCVWSRGPFPAGDPAVAHDGCLFRGGTVKQKKSEWDPESLYNAIPDGRKAIGDSLYGGMPEKCTVAKKGHNKVTRDLIKRAKAREERYHGHTKEFHVLQGRFRHGSSADDALLKHKTVVDSIHVLMHFELEHRPMFDFP